MGVQRFPAVQPRGVMYTRESMSGLPAAVEVSEFEDHAMSIAIDLAGQALSDGNPPVAAVILAHSEGKMWAEKTTDKVAKNLLGHAEISVYQRAQPYVGDDLSDCTLVTTAQPCTDCTPPYASGKIGKIIYAAPRSHVLPIAGIMRVRNTNMADLLADGDTDTYVIENYRAAEALGLFATYGKLKRHPIKKDIGRYLLDIVSNKIFTDSPA